MYPRAATVPPRIAVGAVIDSTTGAVQTTGVLIAVRGEGQSEAAGLGTTAYGPSTGVVYYSPTTAETNYTAFVVTAYKAGCLPMSVTVVTSASTIAGTTSVNNIAANAITATSIAANAITNGKIAAGAITNAAFAANAITANAIASSALSIAKFAADVGSTACATNPIARALGEAATSAMTTAGSFAKRVVDNALQSGDSYSRLGAPAGSSVSADILTKATVTELAKVPKKDAAQSWTNQAGDTQTVTITQV